LDGYNQLDFITGKTNKSFREEFAYFNDDAQLVAFRYKNWKAVFREQSAAGGFRVWSDPFILYRVPKIFNLRMDPYERADLVSDQYYDWTFKNAYLIAWMGFHAIQFLETFRKYPPSQLPASFSVDGVESEINAINNVTLKAPAPVSGAGN